jgi:hypothetical protein
LRRLSPADYDKLTSLLAALDAGLPFQKGCTTLHRPARRYGRWRSDRLVCAGDTLRGAKPLGNPRTRRPSSLPLSRFSAWDLRTPRRSLYRSAWSNFQKNRCCPNLGHSPLRTSELGKIATFLRAQLHPCNWLS